MDSGYILKPADLIFVKGKSLIDHAIEAVSHSLYNHVAGIVKQNELFESNGFRHTGYQSLDVYDGESDVFTCDSLTDDERQRIVQFVLSKLGTRYDYALIGWEYIHFRLHFDLPYHEGNCYDCSELWRQAYKSVGKDPCPNVEYAAPSDLAESTLFKCVGSF